MSTLRPVPPGGEKWAMLMKLPLELIQSIEEGDDPELTVIVGEGDKYVLKQGDQNWPLKQTSEKLLEAFQHVGEDYERVGPSVLGKLTAQSSGISEHLGDRLFDITSEDKNAKKHSKVIDTKSNKISSRTVTKRSPTFNSTSASDAKRRRQSPNAVVQAPKASPTLKRPGAGKSVENQPAAAPAKEAHKNRIPQTIGGKPGPSTRERVLYMLASALHARMSLREINDHGFLPRDIGKETVTKTVKQLADFQPPGKYVLKTALFKEVTEGWPYLNIDELNRLKDNKVKLGGLKPSESTPKAANSQAPGGSDPKVAASLDSAKSSRKATAEEVPKEEKKEKKEKTDTQDTEKSSSKTAQKQAAEAKEGGQSAAEGASTSNRGLISSDAQYAKESEEFKKLHARYMTLDKSLNEKKSHMEQLGTEYKNCKAKGQGGETTKAEIDKVYAEQAPKVKSELEEFNKMHVQLIELKARLKAYARK